MRSFGSRRRTALFRVMAVSGLLGAGLLVRAVPAGASTVTLTTCSTSPFTSAAHSSGTITFDTTSACIVTLTSPVHIPATVNLSIVVTGAPVTISGGESTRLFDVTGGTLSVTDVSLSSGFVGGATGGNGTAGVAAGPGAPGLTGSGTSPGGAGTSGPPATPGLPADPGKAADGGALDISSGTVTLTSVTLANDEAIGGNGGQGGAGGVGSTGGTGGNGGTGAAGGAGGNGAGPGNGGKGGAGGGALGGAIYSAGSLTLISCTFDGDDAYGGNGGSGGPPGYGGFGGAGGEGGFGATGQTGGAGGRAGAATAGAQGGAAGAGEAPREATCTAAVLSP